VAPAAATAFLKLARGAPGESWAERDPITRAYFRELGRVEARAGLGGVTGAAPGADDLGEALRAEGVVLRDRDARPLLEAAAGVRRERLVVRALRRLAASDPGPFAERSGELAYLANALCAGAATTRDRLRPAEALEAAIAAVDLGLEIAIERAATGPAGGDPLPAAARLLRSVTADSLFRLAWHRLHEEAARRGGAFGTGAILEALAAR
jgi:hypothetical protein